MVVLGHSGDGGGGMEGEVDLAIVSWFWSKATVHFCLGIDIRKYYEILNPLY